MSNQEIQPHPPAGGLRAWLGLEHNIIVLLAILLLLGMGEELWIRFIPKYLQLLGAGAWVVAAYGTLRDLLDAVYQYPGGWLADHLGRRRALAVFAVLAIVGYGLYMASPSWPWVLVGTIFVMAWSSLTLPAIFAIIGDNLAHGRRSIGFGVQSIWKRIPIILAPPLGGWLIVTWGLAAGVRVGLAVTILPALLAIVVIERYYRETTPETKETTDMGDLWRRMDPRLKRLLVADCLARWAEGIPKVFIILYVIDVLKADAAGFGWLTGLQMTAATLLYIPVAKLADRANRKPFVLLTFAFFALFPLALVHAGGTLWLAAAFVVAGLREVGEPARKAMILDLAPPAARGRAVGLYYLVRGLAVFPASLVGGWLWGIDPRWPFYSAFAIGVLGCGFYAAWGPGDEPRAA